MSKKYTKVHAIRGHVLRVLRFLANWCGDRLMMYKLRDGSKFVLYPGNNLSELVYIGRDYEPVESKFFRDFLKEGDTVLDVGANIGFYSALFSRKVGSTGKVMSFEPGYQTFALLCRTIKALNLKNVTPYPFALWNKMEILVFSNSTSGFDAQQSVGNREEYGTTSVRIPIPAISGNDLFNSAALQDCEVPTLIKIDVEGAEPQVLEGLSKLLSSAGESLPVLLVECNREALSACGNTSEGLVETLSLRYELYFNELHWPVWHAERSFEMLKPLRSHLPGEMNILAIPKEDGMQRRQALEALRV